MLQCDNFYGLGLLAVILPALFVWLLVRWFKSKSANATSFIEGLLLLGVITCLGLAISSPYLETEQRETTVPLLLDISDSIDPAFGAQLLSQLSEYPDDIRFEIFPFAKETAPIPVTNGDYRTVRSAWNRLDIGHTDLERAFHSVADRGAGSILLLSDGFETAGNSEAVVDTLSAAGIRVHPLVTSGSHDKAVAFDISGLHAPLIAPHARSVDVRTSVRNSTDSVQQGTLVIKHGDKEVLKKKVTLPPNSESVFTAKSDKLQEGIKEVSAELQPDNGALSPTSRTAYISTEERERVLLVSGSEQDERLLKDALAGESYEVDAHIAGKQPSDTFRELKRYSVVMFNNAPKNSVPNEALSAIEHYVRNGGSFVMVGGNRSFGLGGYKDTSIEDVLPVTLARPQKIQKRLNVAVEMVLDKSRSMKDEQKMQFAQAGAREVINSLKDDDYLGIVAFDSTPYRLVEIGELGRIRATALQRLELLFPNLNTRLLGAMDVAGRELERAKAGRKHMIILTDGQVPNAMNDRMFYLRLVEDLRLSGVTVSTFLIGLERAPLLQEIAERGGGTFYRTRDARSLPRLFLDDIKTSVGERTQKESERYDVRKGTGKISSTSISAFPPVLGYVETKAKESANLELVAYANRKAEPLLASWRYKQGRSVAFTSDANGRWSRHWAGWQRYRQFWVEVLDSLRPDSGEAADSVKFDLHSYLEKGTLVLDLSVYTEGLSGSMVAKVTLPNNEVRDVPFRSISKGRYLARLDDITAGTYKVSASLGDRKLTPVAFALSGELFGEKKGAGVDRVALAKLARETGGTINPTPELLRQHATVRKSRRELAPYLFSLALLLLLLDILRREVWRTSRVFRRRIA